jgi:hypothetical protein
MQTEREGLKEELEIARAEAEAARAETATVRHELELQKSTCSCTRRLCRRNLDRICQCVELPESLISKQVFKKHGNQVYRGTVINTSGKTWGVEYEDGDRDEFHFKEMMEILLTGK